MTTAIQLLLDCPEHDVGESMTLSAKWRYRADTLIQCCPDQKKSIRRIQDTILVKDHDMSLVSVG